MGDVSTRYKGFHFLTHDVCILPRTVGSRERKRKGEGTRKIYIEKVTNDNGVMAAVTQL